MAVGQTGNAKKSLRHMKDGGVYILIHCHIIGGSLRKFMTVFTSVAV